MHRTSLTPHLYRANATGQIETQSASRSSKEFLELSLTAYLTSRLGSGGDALFNWGLLMSGPLWSLPR